MTNRWVFVSTFGNGFVLIQSDLMLQYLIFQPLHRFTIYINKNINNNNTIETTKI